MRKEDKAEKIAHEIKRGMYKDFIKTMKQLERIEKSKKVH